MTFGVGVMKSAFLSFVLLAILGVTLWWAVHAWNAVDVEMSVHGYVAMTLGIIFSLVVGCGLMALMFYSSRYGYDDDVPVMKYEGILMRQKTEGRVVRLFTKYVGAEGRSTEQWFLVAIGDDDKATDAVAKSANAADAVFEIVGHIPATTLASWGMAEGEVRLVLPGEPIVG